MQRWNLTNEARSVTAISVFKSEHAFCHREFAAVFSVLEPRRIERVQLQTVQRETFHCEVVRKRRTYIRACTVSYLERSLEASSTDFAGALTSDPSVGACRSKNVSALAAEVAPRACEFYVVDEYSSTGETSRERGSQDLRLLIDGVSATTRIHGRDSAHTSSYMASYSRGRSSRQSE